MFSKSRMFSNNVYAQIIRQTQAMNTRYICDERIPITSLKLINRSRNAFWNKYEIKKYHVTRTLLYSFKHVHATNEHYAFYRIDIMRHCKQTTPCSKWRDHTLAL